MKHTQLVSITHVAEDASGASSVYNKAKMLRDDLSESIDLAKDVVLGFIEANHGSQLERVEGMFEEGIGKVMQEREELLKGKPDDIIEFVSTVGNYTWTTRSETTDDIILEMKIRPNQDFDFDFHIVVMIKSALSAEESSWQAADILITPGATDQLNFKDFFDVTNVQYMDDAARIIVEVDRVSGALLGVGSDRGDVVFEVIAKVDEEAQEELNHLPETTLLTTWDDVTYKRFQQQALPTKLFTEQEVRQFYKSPLALKGLAFKDEE